MSLTRIAARLVMLKSQNKILKTRKILERRNKRFKIHHSNYICVIIIMEI